VDDNAKLLKVLEYLKLTRNKDKNHLLQEGAPRVLVAYVDASFASHSDGKGHTVLLLSGEPPHLEL
jgi:hypothetical protein